MSVPIRRFVNVNVAFENFVDGESVGNESIDTNGNLYEWHGPALRWVQTRSGGAARVSDVGIPSQRHNRYLTGITATWPGNDTFSVSFTQAEDVRRYRILALGGAAGDFVKWTEDAVNEAQAEAMLGTPTSSSSANVAQQRVYAVPAGTVVTQQHWSEWQELSKDPADDSLSRLDFLASAAGPFTVIVEAE